MTKHTGGEGEWKWVIKGQNIVTANGEIGIAKVSNNIGQPREANARLIAQCPPMYDYISQRADNGDTEAKKIISQINA